MRRFSTVVLFGAACSGQGGTAQDPTGDGSGGTTQTPPGESTADVPAESGTSASPESSGAADPVGDPPIIFDVGGVDDPADACAEKADGAYCKDNRTAYTCGGGATTATTPCGPDYCLEGTCVDCLSGMNACHGNRVMQCNDAADPPVWDEVEVCDAAAGQGCDLGLVTCVDLQPVGDTVPTGTYYKYADFATGAVYQGGCDVDSFDNRIYVSGGSPFETFVTEIDVYEVELLDSDNDGEAERNQHPDNPDEPGPIEERVLTHVETIPIASGCPAPASSCAPRTSRASPRTYRSPAGSPAATATRRCRPRADRSSPRRRWPIASSRSTRRPASCAPRPGCRSSP